MLTSVEEFLIFGFIPLLIGIFAAPPTETAPEPVISGRLVIPPSTTLRDDAVAIVELVELQRGETVQPALASQITGWRGSTEHGFAIRFDPSQIRPAGSYAVRARIIADATVWFETPLSAAGRAAVRRARHAGSGADRARLKIGASGAATIR